MGDVEVEHHGRHPGLEDDPCSVRVDVEIELGRGRDVALAPRTPHEHDLGQPRDDPRLLDDGERHVGEGPRGDQRHAALRPCHDDVDDRLHGVGPGQRQRRLGQHHAVEAGLAVHLLGRDQRAQDGPGAAGMHRHVPAPGQLDDAPGVADDAVERHVAGDGRDGQDLELVRARQRHEQGHGVVLARIAVDDDAAWRQEEPPR